MIQSKEEIQKLINKNRDEIERLVYGGECPLDILYKRVRILSASNERLIDKLNKK